MGDRDGACRAILSENAGEDFREQICLARSRRVISASWDVPEGAN